MNLTSLRKSAQNITLHETWNFFVEQSIFDVDV